MTNELTSRASAVLQAVSIFDMLRELGGGRELHGDGTQQIRCPIHDDRTPSARIYEPVDGKPGKIWCFTCARNFDAIDLVQAKFKFTFAMAVEWLEARFTVAPASASLSVRLHATLSKTYIAPLDDTFAFVEHKVIASRGVMTQTAFTKACTALDVAAYRFRKGTLTYDATQATLKRILETTP